MKKHISLSVARPDPFIIGLYRRVLSGLLDSYSLYQALVAFRDTVSTGQIKRGYFYTGVVEPDSLATLIKNITTNAKRIGFQGPVREVGSRQIAYTFTKTFEQQLYTLVIWVTPKEASGKINVDVTIEEASGT